MNGKLNHLNGMVVDGWPVLVAFAFSWLAFVVFALTLASGILVA
jgi:hypothetical protein